MQLKIAALQMISTRNVAENLDKATQMIAEAANNGAQVIVLPEFFAKITTSDDPYRTIHSETLNNGLIQAHLKKIAILHGIYIIAGSILLDSHIPNKFYNSCLVISPDGATLAHYNKIHLFKFNDGSQRYDESEILLDGDNVVSCDILDFKFGLAICYDLRFPELFRALGVVDVIVLPSAFTYQTGLAHWELLIRARAVENQCYFLGVNQGGEHETGRKTYGHSMLVDPWGEVVISAAEGEKIIYAIIDSGRIKDIRTKLPALEHRRIS
jgi:predicted amidohydrolase